MTDAQIHPLYSTFASYFYRAKAFLSSVNCSERVVLRKYNKMYNSGFAIEIPATDIPPEDFIALIQEAWASNTPDKYGFDVLLSLSSSIAIIYSYNNIASSYVLSIDNNNRIVAKCLPGASTKSNFCYIKMQEEKINIDIAFELLAATQQKFDLNVDIDFDISSSSFHMNLFSLSFSSNGYLRRPLSWDDLVILKSEFNIYYFSKRKITQNMDGYAGLFSSLNTGVPAVDLTGIVDPKLLLMNNTNVLASHIIQVMLKSMQEYAHQYYNSLNPEVIENMTFKERSEHIRNNCLLFKMYSEHYFPITLFRDVYALIFKPYGLANIDLVDFDIRSLVDNNIEVRCKPEGTTTLKPVTERLCASIFQVSQAKVIIANTKAQLKSTLETIADAKPFTILAFVLPKKHYELKSSLISAFLKKYKLTNIYVADPALVQESQQKYENLKFYNLRSNFHPILNELRIKDLSYFTLDLDTITRIRREQTYYCFTNDLIGIPQYVVYSWFLFNLNFVVCEYVPGAEIPSDWIYLCDPNVNVIENLILANREAFVIEIIDRIRHQSLALPHNSVLFRLLQALDPDSAKVFQSVSRDTLYPWRRYYGATTNNLLLYFNIAKERSALLKNIDEEISELINSFLAKYPLFKKHPALEDHVNYIKERLLLQTNDTQNSNTQA